jgi:homoserine O-acetyltransferase
MRKIFVLGLVAFSLVALAFWGTCLGLDQLVEKRTFTMEEFTLVSGKKLGPVRIGYETYGQLNGSGDNAILICPFFGGDSHAAGRYSAEDKISGYWDSIIGPGKAIDTDKYFVISSDVLCNLNTKNPGVVTTGPATVDPKTGKPYGMSFPLVTIRDFVNVQHELVKSLGVRKLAAVTGASMGGFQTFDWAAAYPDLVERAIPVISTPKAHAWLVGWINLWGMPVMEDPKWNGGDYYDKEEPIQGLVNALRVSMLNVRWADWADQTFDRNWADPQQNPQEAMPNRFLVQKLLTDWARDRAKMADANSMLYLIKACTLFDLGQEFGAIDKAFAKIRARVFMIGVDSDTLFTPNQIASYLEPMSKAGVKVSYHEIKSSNGHLGGILDIGQAQEAIAKFMGN